MRATTKEAVWIRKNPKKAKGVKEKECDRERLQIKSSLEKALTVKRRKNAYI